MNIHDDIQVLSCEECGVTVGEEINDHMDISGIIICENCFEFNYS